MIRKFLSFYFLLFVTLNNLTDSIPIRRHHSYYHHRSPYHVNYSPYTLSKRGPYFAAESTAFNDLDDHMSNEPVKGGIKNTVQTQIKTPMKLFSERNKNGYLTGGFSSLQEKYSEAKRVNPSSIKQQQHSSDSSIIYPNESGSNDDKNLDVDSSTVLDLNKKKVESSSKKGSSKTNTKLKITTAATQSLESSTQSSLAPQETVKIKIIENNIKDAPVVNNEKPNLDAKVNQLDTKSSSSLPSSSTTEQSVTTLSDLNLSSSSSSSGNVEPSLDIKEIKVDTVSDIVKLDTPNEAVKVDSSKVNSVDNVVKTETNISKSQPESSKIAESVVNKIDKLEDKPEVVIVKQPENSSPDLVKVVDIVTNPQIVNEDVKPIVVESSIQTNKETVNELDIRKKVDNPEEKLIGDVNVINTNSKNIVLNVESNVDEIVPKTDLNTKKVNHAENLIKQPSSSVDVVPSDVSLNTENSLIVENETKSSLIN